MNGLSRAVLQPAHVPDATVLDFDMFMDPELLSNPHERVCALPRKTLGGVFWTPRNGGHWTAINHAANFAVAREFFIFSSSSVTPEERAQYMAMQPPGARHVPRAFPITLDPPRTWQVSRAVAVGVDSLPLRWN